jgi:hypothetical protein
MSIASVTQTGFLNSKIAESSPRRDPPAHVSTRLWQKRETVPCELPSRYNGCMPSIPSKLADWTPEQVALGKRWVQTWIEAGPRLERIRREELRRLDPVRAIALLCGSADYSVPPRAPKPTSGLVEQQHWFMKAAARGD